MRINWLRAQADASRRVLNAEGFVEHTVSLRPMGDTGPGPALLGNPGAPTGPDILITPGPRVERLSLEMIAINASVLQAGDLLITGIPRNPAWDGILITRGVLWIIAGPYYTGTYNLVGPNLLKELTIGWEAVVRRVGK